MITDVVFAVVAVTWMILSSLTNNGAAFVAWLGVLVYSGINLTEHRLKGSKYDY